MTTPDIQAVRDETTASGQHKDLIRACNLAGLSYADCMRIVAYMPVLSHHEDGGRAEPVWCSCGDAIMPDTGAKCGVCASGVALGGEKGEAVRGTNWQERCLEMGFKYWRAPDAHGVTCTVEQATELLVDVLGVEVEIDSAANLTAARVMIAERDHARAEKDRIFQIMMSVWNLVHHNPDGFEVDGVRYLYNDPNAAATLRMLSKSILAIPEKLAQSTGVALGGEKGEAVAQTKNALRPDHPLAKGDCVHGESMAKHCAWCSAAPVGKARMLTEAEADHITGMHNTGRSQGDSECAEAIQRKFCEVNGITLEAK